MVAERRGQHPSLLLLRARGSGLGLAAGAIPAAMMLAVLVEAVPPVVSPQVEAIAYFLYYISLPSAAFLFRIRVRSATVGFVIGVILTTGMVIVNVIVAAAHSVAGGY